MSKRTHPIVRGPASCAAGLAVSIAALEAMRVPVACIAGTRAGSAVGAAHAMGLAHVVRASMAVPSAFAPVKVGG